LGTYCTDIINQTKACNIIHLRLLSLNKSIVCLNYVQTAVNEMQTKLQATVRNIIIITSSLQTDQQVGLWLGLGLDLGLVLVNV